MVPPTRLLIADDDETFLFSTADLLRKKGYICDTARDAEAAKKLLNDQVFNLLIADIKMPGNLELELIEEIHKSEHSLPVILVTGYPTVDSAIQSIELPVVAYLVKPFDLDELLSTIKKALKSHNVYQLAANSQARLEEWVDQLESFKKEVINHPGKPNIMPVQTFNAFAIQTVLETLVNMKSLVESLEGSKSHREICALFHCPVYNSHRRAINETIKILEKTKSAFKSKELGLLRKMLEDIQNETNLKK